MFTIEEANLCSGSLFYRLFITSGGTYIHASVPDPLRESMSCGFAIPERILEVSVAQIAPWCVLHDQENTKSDEKVRVA